MQLYEDFERDQIAIANKSQKENKIVVLTDWKYVKEYSPAFKRLMMLLLQPSGNQSVEKGLTVEEEKDE